MKCRIGRVAFLAAITLSITLSAGEGKAGVISYLGGSATFTFQSGFDGAVNPPPLTVDIPLQVNPPMQFSSHVADVPTHSNGFSDAQGGTSAFFAPLLAGLNLPAGMGLSQSAPAGSATPASFRVDFNNVRYQTDGGGLPNSFLFDNIFVSGFVGSGPGSFASWQLSLTATSATLGNMGTLVDGQNFTTPGDFQGESHLTIPTINQSFPANDEITLTGFFEFQVQNDGSPTSISLSQDSGFNSPEPATITLLGIGVTGIAGYAWRRKKQHARA